MKTIFILFFTLLCLSTQAQQWFDPTCKKIDSKTNLESLSSTETRNTLKVIVNQADVIELNDEEQPNISEIAFKEWVLGFISNPDKNINKAENPEKIYVLLKSINKNSETLDKLKEYVQDVYLYLWDKQALDRYNSSYIDLDCSKRAKIFKKYPLKMLFDPGKTNQKKDNTKPKRFGVPPFGGDVIDN